MEEINKKVDELKNECDKLINDNGNLSKFLVNVLKEVDDNYKEYNNDNYILTLISQMEESQNNLLSKKDWINDNKDKISNYKELIKKIDDSNQKSREFIAKVIIQKLLLSL
jgi:uncharacterized coiled-coil DUF342 family protein